ncbi:MAG: aldehyde dehydrogenase family protein, partial [Dongiaceae bacterium]
RALRVAERTQAGAVWINTYRMASTLAPFGGFKNSGYGREGGMQSIYDYTRSKTIWISTSSEPVANPFVMR